MSFARLDVFGRDEVSGTMKAGSRPGVNATEKQDIIHMYIMKTVENRLEAGVKTVDSH